VVVDRGFWHWIGRLQCNHITHAFTTANTPRPGATTTFTTGTPHATTACAANTSTATYTPTTWPHTTTSATSTCRQR
jgi:hypothetical protein